MDIFVEPILPHPAFLILGASPVALSLSTLARQLGYCVTIAAPAGELSGTADADVLVDGYQPGPLNEARRFVVVSTQGKGDEAALRAAVSIDGAYHAFVGSRRKMTALREKLVADGIAAAVPSDQGARRPRSWCDHARRNRIGNFGRDDRLAPVRSTHPVPMQGFEDKPAPKTSQQSSDLPTARDGPRNRASICG